MATVFWPDLCSFRRLTFSLGMEQKGQEQGRWPQKGSSRAAESVLRMLFLTAPHASQVLPSRGPSKLPSPSCNLSLKDVIRDDGCQTTFFCLLWTHMHWRGASFPLLRHKQLQPHYAKIGRREAGRQLVSWPGAHSCYFKGKGG